MGGGGTLSPQSTLDKNSLSGIGLNLTFSVKLGFAQKNLVNHKISLGLFSSNLNNTL